MANPPATKLELWLEQRFPGYRYGVVLVLLVTTYVFMAAGPTHVVARVVTVGLQGVTLLTTLIASRSGRRLFRIAVVVVVLAFLAAVASAFLDDTSDPTGVFFALNVLLVGRARWSSPKRSSGAASSTSTPSWARSASTCSSG